MSAHQLHRALARLNLRCFNIRPQRVQILRTPTAFYESLIERCDRATTRVTLSALYWGTGPLALNLAEAVARAASRGCSARSSGGGGCPSASTLLGASCARARRTPRAQRAAGRRSERRCASRRTRRCARGAWRTAPATVAAPATPLCSSLLLPRLCCRNKALTRVH